MIKLKNDAQEKSKGIKIAKKNMYTPITQLTHTHTHTHTKRKTIK